MSVTCELGLALNKNLKMNAAYKEGANFLVTPAQRIHKLLQGDLEQAHVGPANILSYAPANIVGLTRFPAGHYLLPVCVLSWYLEKDSNLRPPSNGRSTFGHRIVATNAYDILLSF